MPPSDQIISGLREVTNAWELVSVLWHIYFGAFAIVLVMGVRPSKRIAGLLLGLPFLSVSAFAGLSSNPFNSVVFGILGLGLLLIAANLPPDRAQVAPLWSLISGVLLFGFGWIYPHFLNTSSYLPYLYAAPVGTIQCPTLILGIGFILILDGLGSRRLCTLLGLVGLFYGIIGVLYLHIGLDWVLILGSCIILFRSMRRNWDLRPRSNI